MHLGKRIEGSRLKGIQCLGRAHNIKSTMPLLEGVPIKLKDRTVKTR